MLVKTILIVPVAWLTSLALSPAAAAQSADVAVVVSDKNPAVNISLPELRKIFVGEKRTWPGGRRIKLIVRAPGSRGRLVLLKFLGMSETEYKQYWTAQVFRGEADTEPLAVPSIGMQREALTVFSEAITLVDAKDVKPGMKVLKLDGQLPGDAGYALH